MDELPRYPLLFNPNARGHKGRQALKFIMANATRFVLYATRSEEEAVALVKQFVEAGEPVVIAAGGDGTLNAVTQGLKGTATTLGVFPSGTMNVFARELGIAVPGLNNMPLDKALKVIDHGEVKKVDLFTVNQRSFIQMAGVGFDAQVIEETKPSLKKRFGPLTYLASAVKVLGKEPPKLTLTLPNGEVHEGSAIITGNGGFYGGQVKLFTKADNNDELLDFIIFKEKGYRMMLDALAGLRGKVESDKNTITYIQAESAVIESNIEVPLQVDGDFIGKDKRFTFARESKRLKVMAPTVPHSTALGNLMKKILPVSQ